jgi:hypothetical protein
MVFLNPIVIDYSWRDGQMSDLPKFQLFCHFLENKSSLYLEYIIPPNIGDFSKEFLSLFRICPPLTKVTSQDTEMINVSPVKSSEYKQLVTPQADMTANQRSRRRFSTQELLLIGNSVSTSIREKKTK